MTNTKPLRQTVDTFTGGKVAVELTEVEHWNADRGDREWEVRDLDGKLLGKVELSSKPNPRTHGKPLPVWHSSTYGYGSEYKSRAAAIRVLLRGF